MKEIVKCSECNKEFAVQIFGKPKDREWKRNSFTWICDDCKKEKRENENELSAEKNKEAGLPALEGSEKQIAWAETIRASKISEIEKIYKPQLYTQSTYDFLKQKYGEIDNRLNLTIETLKRKTNASWWIDNRNSGISNIITELFEQTELPNEKEEREKAQKEEQELIESAKIESTVQPSKPVTSTVAEIAVKDNLITISFPEKRDDFRTVVKKYGYTWKDCWQKNVKQNIEDSAAQIGHILLSKGFGIRIFNESIRNMAVEGNFKSENFNRIALAVTGKYEGWLAISWNRNIEDFYNRARKIKGSRWNSPCVAVPPENYIEVQDFAEMYGFYFTEKAEEAINKQIEAKEKILTVDIPEVNISTTKQNAKPVLEVPIVEVADELKD